MVAILPRRTGRACSPGVRPVEGLAEVAEVAVPGPDLRAAAHPVEPAVVPKALGARLGAGGRVLDGPVVAPDLEPGGAVAGHLDDGVARRLAGERARHGGGASAREATGGHRERGHGHGNGTGAGSHRRLLGFGAAGSDARGTLGAGMDGSGPADGRQWRRRREGPAVDAGWL